MKIFHKLLFIFFFINAITIQAQNTYPQNYFRNPLNIPMQLAANFGAVRTNHFHMGLDLRTNSQENLMVVTAADGYVSRIKVERYGFGNAVYITHPNGYTTLYAHLNKYYDQLDEYVKERQYKDEKCEQDIIFSPGQFPVTQGQLIALSGNTGGSAGPHLHFEIRDTKTEECINPLLFGFNIPDSIAPVISGLYWYDRRFSTYEPGANGIAVKKMGNMYTTDVIQVSSPTISLAIKAVDKANQGFNLGIYHAELLMDDEVMYSFSIDKVSYDDTRYINGCIDYPKLIQDKMSIQHLSSLPGMKLKNYSPSDLNGIINLKDENVHSVEIILKDFNGNTSRLKTKVKLSKTSDQISSTNTTVKANERKTITTENAEINLSKNAVYDAVNFQMSEKSSTNRDAVSNTIVLHSPYIPVHDNYTLKIKPNRKLTNEEKGKVVVLLDYGSDTNVAKGKWNGDRVESEFNRLGTATLLLDQSMPSVSPGWKEGALITGSTLRLKGAATIGDIVAFRAELDGKWLRFARMKDDFVYIFDEKCPRASGSHTLKVTTVNAAGNTNTQTFTFQR
ncbi:M23 family metallopeptidase [Chryseobacterium carnipullorum]|uniref:M23 family metallopeptidase n=1 Tax=Chryseobacterium carnipullorum TaxID=1124835 RepID=A0A376EVT4_CHRCU|nr:M23 family metallopeptidase [Chryseobacterium carnipullorum]AZA48169.1 M23 family metallopeptidase [Chryseobacterium carnipullorum]AZA67477.1 M23 family metallopeptidase [Chryseobacterium carnipullorum]STD14377.1 putative peptidase [Chryseobacterium carnipullorum]